MALRDIFDDPDGQKKLILGGLAIETAVKAVTYALVAVILSAEVVGLVVMGAWLINAVK